MTSIRSTDANTPDTSQQVTPPNLQVVDGKLIGGRGKRQSGQPGDFGNGRLGKPGRGIDGILETGGGVL